MIATWRIRSPPGRFLIPPLNSTPAEVYTFWLLQLLEKAMPYKSPIGVGQTNSTINKGPSEATKHTEQCQPTHQSPHQPTNQPTSEINKLFHSSHQTAAIQPFRPFKQKEPHKPFTTPYQSITQQKRETNQPYHYSNQPTNRPKHSAKIIQTTNEIKPKPSQTIRIKRN